MKAMPLIVALIFALLAAACGPKVVKMPEKPTPTPGEAQAALYSKAEAFYAGGNLESAMTAYQEYVDGFPKAAHAADALMRIGAIHRSMGNLEQALGAFSRVASEYPHSGRRADAMVETLSIYYQQGAYDLVIAQVDGLLEHPLTTENIYRAYTVLGDAYRASGRPEEAVRSYAAAIRFASDEERTALLERIETATESLDSEKVVSLLGYLDDPLARGYLLFRLGSGYYQAGRYPEAVNTLSEFVDLYPDHKMVSEARELLEKIGQRSPSGRFVIGCLLPLSGPSAVFGEQALEGAELALNRFHSSEGGPSVEIIVKDTASDPQKTVEAIRDLSQKNVVAIIGPIFTAPAAATEAQRLEIPIVAISQKDDIAQTGDYVFRNFFTPKMQVQALVDYAVTRLNLSRFAILYPDDKYGQTFMNLFWDEVISRGASVVGVESYKGTHTDFADPIKKLAGAYHRAPAKRHAPGSSKEVLIVDFEALFIPDSPRRAGLVIPQLAYNDVTGIQLFGTNLWHSELLLTMARAYVQGAVMPDIFFDGSENPSVRSFVESFTDAYERKPGFIEAILYDTTMMLLQVLKEPGIDFRPSVRNRLLNLRGFAGVTGVTSFGDDGDAQKSLYLLRVEGNRFVEVP